MTRMFSTSSRGKGRMAPLSANSIKSKAATSDGGKASTMTVQQAEANMPTQETSTVPIPGLNMAGKSKLQVALEETLKSSHAASTPNPKRKTGDVEAESQVGASADSSPVGGGHRNQSGENCDASKSQSKKGRKVSHIDPPPPTSVAAAVHSKPLATMPQPEVKSGAKYAMSAALSARGVHRLGPSPPGHSPRVPSPLGSSVRGISAQSTATSASPAAPSGYKFNISGNKISGSSAAAPAPALTPVQAQPNLGASTITLTSSTATAALTQPLPITTPSATSSNFLAAATAVAPAVAPAPSISSSSSASTTGIPASLATPIKLEDQFAVLKVDVVNSLSNPSQQIDQLRQQQADHRAEWRVESTPPIPKTEKYAATVSILKTEQDAANKFEASAGGPLHLEQTQAWRQTRHLEKMRHKQEVQDKQAAEHAAKEEKKDLKKRKREIKDVNMDRDSTTGDEEYHKKKVRREAKQEHVRKIKAELQMDWKLAPTTPKLTRRQRMNRTKRIKKMEANPMRAVEGEPMELDTTGLVARRLILSEVSLLPPEEL